MCAPRASLGRGKATGGSGDLSKLRLCDTGAQPYAKVLLPRRQIRLPGQGGNEQLPPPLEIIVGDQLKQRLVTTAALLKRHRERMRNGRGDRLRIVGIDQQRCIELRGCSRKARQKN